MDDYKDKPNVIKLHVADDKGNVHPVILSIDSLVSSTLREIPSREARLRETEWQRWTPFVGIYRLFADQKDTTTHLLLEGMHSLLYQNVNLIYNVFWAVAGFNAIAKGVDYLYRLP